MIVHEGKKSSTHKKREQSLRYGLSTTLGTAHSRYNVRDIVTAIRHTWTVVCGEILKVLQKVALCPSRT